jgi:hypothetical protein
MLKYLGVLFTFLPLLIQAQSFDLGSWNILNLKLNVNSKWSLICRDAIKIAQILSPFSLLRI